MMELNRSPAVATAVFTLALALSGCGGDLDARMAEVRALQDVDVVGHDLHVGCEVARVLVTLDAAVQVLAHRYSVCWWVFPCQTIIPWPVAAVQRL